MAGEGFLNFLGEFLDIRLAIAFFVGHLEAAAEVDELQLLEFGYKIEEYPDAFYEDVDVLDLAAGVDMEIGDAQFVLVDQPEDLIDLVDGDAKFAFIMPGADLEVA